MTIVTLFISQLVQISQLILVYISVTYNHDDIIECLYALINFNLYILNMIQCTDECISILVCSIMTKDRFLIVNHDYHKKENAVWTVKKCSFTYRENLLFNRKNSIFSMTEGYSMSMRICKKILVKIVKKLKIFSLMNCFLRDMDKFDSCLFMCSKLSRAEVALKFKMEDSGNQIRQKTMKKWNFLSRKPIFQKTKKVIVYISNPDTLKWKYKPPKTVKKHEIAISEYEFMIMINFDTYAYTWPLT